MTPFYPSKAASGASPGGPDLDHFGRPAFQKCHLKYNTFALGTQKCAPGEHRGDIFVKRQTYSLKICFLYSFKAHFWMVPIFDDFAPSLFSPSASGSSLPSSEAPFGTLSGCIWASFWAWSGARNPLWRASRAHFDPVLVQSCLRTDAAAPKSPQQMRIFVSCIFSSLQTLTVTLTLTEI